MEPLQLKAHQLRVAVSYVRHSERDPHTLMTFKREMNHRRYYVMSWLKTKHMKSI